jgi:exodeoxyribonuclease VII large subunit
MTAPLTITALTLAIKGHLEQEFGTLLLQGEISNFKEQTSGHLYFSLKDEGAQISAVLFKGNTRNLNRLPQSGDQVIVKGELTVYPPKGNYQLIVRELRFAGIGELLLKFQELKAKLQSQGWFNPQIKKKLPKIPKRIGVITSPTGAVIQDILHILKRRFSGFQLLLNPVKVQGEGAAVEIAKAIADFNRYNLADVLIVGRGGGSLEDLSPFNEEIVASAIFASKIPIISAVGHETDFSIADFVADVRAPTPSAAAEIVIAEKEVLLHRLRQIAKHPFLFIPYTLLGKQHQEVDEMRADCNTAILQDIQQKKLRLEALKKQLSGLKPTQQLIRLKEKLEQLDKGITACILQTTPRKQQFLSKLVSHLQAVDPRNVLTRGYCILFAEKSGSVIISSGEVVPQEEVKVLFSDGSANATINIVNVYATTR